MDEEIKVLMHGKKKDRYVVNPYLVPSKWKTFSLFIDELKKEPMLSVLTEEVPIEGADKYEDKEYFRYRLFIIAGGEKDETKKGIIEDCLLQFWKVLIKSYVSEDRLKKANTVEKRIKAYQLHPIIVQVMYKQLFVELKRNGIEYDHGDFGIGKNDDFLFNKVYREDHPDLF